MSSQTEKGKEPVAEPQQPKEEQTQTPVKKRGTRAGKRKNKNKGAQDPEQPSSSTSTPNAPPLPVAGQSSNVGSSSSSAPQPAAAGSGTLGGKPPVMRPFAPPEKVASIFSQATRAAAQPQAGPATPASTSERTPSVQARGSLAPAAAAGRAAHVTGQQSPAARGQPANQPSGRGSSGAPFNRGARRGRGIVPQPRIRVAESERAANPWGADFFGKIMQHDLVASSSTAREKITDQSLDKMFAQVAPQGSDSLTQEQKYQHLKEMAEVQNQHAISLEETISSLKAQNLKQENKLHEFRKQEKEAANQEIEIQNLRDQIAEYEEENASRRNEEMIHAALGAESEAELEELRRQLRERDESLAYIRQENDRLTFDLEAATASIDKLKKEKASLAEGMSRDGSGSEALRGELETLRSEVSRLQRAESDSAALVLKLEGERDSTHSSLTSENKQLRSELEEAREALAAELSRRQEVEQDEEEDKAEDEGRDAAEPEAPIEAAEEAQVDSAQPDVSQVEAEEEPRPFVPAHRRISSLPANISRLPVSNAAQTDDQPATTEGAAQTYAPAALSPRRILFLLLFWMLFVIAVVWASRRDARRDWVHANDLSQSTLADLGQPPLIPFLCGEKVRYSLIVSMNLNRGLLG